CSVGLFDLSYQPNFANAKAVSIHLFATCFWRAFGKFGSAHDVITTRPELAGNALFNESRDHPFRLIYKGFRHVGVNLSVDDQGWGLVTHRHLPSEFSSRLRGPNSNCSLSGGSPFLSALSRAAFAISLRTSYTTASILRRTARSLEHRAAM